MDLVVEKTKRTAMGEDEVSSRPPLDLLQVVVRVCYSPAPFCA